MSNITQPEFSKPLVPPTGMRGEIQQKWGKFSAQEITALKDNDDLVAKVQLKYQLDKPQAQRDVDAFAKGRQL
jgi:hypothetical protein